MTVGNIDAEGHQRRYGWDFCVRCWENPPDSSEHLIQKSLGGLLAWPLLCAPCNSHYGSTLDHQLKSDPRIRLAIWNLRAVSPDVFRRLARSLRFIGSSKSGPQVSLVLNEDGTFKTRAAQVEGSIIVDSADSQHFIRSTLEKRGVPRDQIEAIAHAFDAAEIDETVFYAPGEALIKRKIEKIFPQLTGKLASDSAVLKVCFCVLCLLMDPKQYPDYFGPILDSIDGREIPPWVSVDVRLNDGGKTAPYHRVHIRPKPNCVEVSCFILETVVLHAVFDWIAMPNVPEIRLVMNLESRKIFRAT